MSSFMAILRILDLQPRQYSSVFTFSGQQKSRMTRTGFGIGGLEMGFTETYRLQSTGA